MKNSLKFAKDELNATKAVVSIITSDIYRPYLLLANNKKCSMFLKPSNIFSECGQNPATWWHVPKTLKKSELINFVAKKYNYGLIPTSKIVLKDIEIEFKKAAFLLSLLKVIPICPTFVSVRFGITSRSIKLLFLFTVTEIS